MLKKNHRKRTVLRTETNKIAESREKRTFRDRRIKIRGKKKRKKEIKRIPLFFHACASTRTGNADLSNLDQVARDRRWWNRSPDYRDGNSALGATRTETCSRESLERVEKGGRGHAGRNGTKAREDGIVAKEPPGAAVVPNFDRKTAPDFSDWRRPR